MELAHGLRRILDVLEHLRAEHEVEGAVLDRQRLHGPFEVGCRVADVDTDVAVGIRLEVRQVRLDSGTDVQHPVTAQVGMGARGLCL